MKRQTASGSKHISIEMAKYEIDFFESQGYKITDHGHKITAEKQ